MPIFLIVSLLLIFYYINRQPVKELLINDISYQTLKDLGESEAPKLFALLDEKYTKLDLLYEDKIQIAFLKGLGYYKQGDYTNSVQQLKQAIEISEKNQNILASADAHTLLADIYVYQSKYDEKWQHLNAAEKIYTQLSNTQGLDNVMVSRGRYYIAIDDFDKSFQVFNQLLKQAKENNNIPTQVAVLYNTSHLYQLLNKFDKAKNDLNQMLELSLSIGDGENLAKAYSSLSNINKLQGHL